MNKSYVFFIPIMIVVLILLPANGQSLERPKNVEINLVGFVVGTSLHFRAELIAEALRKEYPDWNIRAVSTPKGAFSVFQHRQNKTADFFVSLTPRSQEKEIWTPIYKKKGINFDREFNWYGVVPLAVKYVHFIVLKNTGINSIKEIVDKKYPVKVGMTRPISDGLFERCIKYYGATLEDVESWGGKFVNVSSGAPVGPEAMRQGRINVAFAWTGIPNPPFLQAAADLDLRLLPVAREDEHLKMMKEIDYYRVAIPANTYSFNESNVTTIAQTEWLAYIPGTLPEGVVYYVTKGIWNQKDFLIKSLPEFAVTMSSKYISNSMDQFGGDAIHDESLSFYKEKGWIK